MLLAALLACKETCPTPQSRLDEVVWTVFVQPVEYSVDGEGFPAETSPGNGVHEVEIRWLSDQLFRGELTVVMDGQEFDGTGTWSETDCGHFGLSWSGQYVAETGDIHAFGAGGQLATFGTKLDGWVDWEESWKTADDGAVGTFAAATEWFGSSN